MAQAMLSRFLRLGLPSLGLDRGFEAILVETGGTLPFAQGCLFLLSPVGLEGNLSLRRTYVIICLFSNLKTFFGRVTSWDELAFSSMCSIMLASSFFCWLQRESIATGHIFCSIGLKQMAPSQTALAVPKE